MVPAMSQTQTARAAPVSFRRHRLQLQMRPALQMQARRSLSSRLPAPFLQSRSRAEGGAASQCRQEATVLTMHWFRLRGGPRQSGDAVVAARLQRRSAESRVARHVEKESLALFAVLCVLCPHTATC